MVNGKSFTSKPSIGQKIPLLRKHYNAPVKIRG